MKVLYAIGSGRGWGGARTIALDLLEGSVRAGHRVHVLSWAFEDVVEHAIACGIRATISPYLLARTHEVSHLVPLGRIIRRLAPDVIYTMFPFPYRAHLRLAALTARAPVVTQVWSGLRWNAHSAFAAVQKTIDRATSYLPGAVVAPSHDLYRQLLDIGVPEKRLRLIPYGVRPDVVAAASAPLPASVERMLSRYRHRVVYVARLDENKNQAGALTVFAKARVDDACLILVGKEDEPGYETVLRKRAAELGIEERVLLTGDTDRNVAWTIMGKASVFLQTSRHEGFGQASLEAQSRGIPVVTYRAGGMVDVVSDRKTGFLVDIDNEGAAADRLHRLLADESLRKSMGDEARRWVRERFDLDDRLPELFAVFEELALERVAVD